MFRSLQMSEEEGVDFVKNSFVDFAIVESHFTLKVAEPK